MSTPNDPDKAALLAYCQERRILRTNAGRDAGGTLKNLRQGEAAVERALFPPALFHLLR